MKGHGKARKSACCLFIAAILTATVGNLAQAAGDFVRNGDAETGALDNWQGFDGVVSEGSHGGKHCFMRAGSGEILSTDLIPVDTSKAYRLSGWFKSNGKVESVVHFGYMPYDAEKKPIHPVNVACWPGTDTVLAADCHVDDMVVKVANGARWGTYGGAVIAFKADDSGQFADLPNRNISSSGIVKVVNAGPYWEVYLQNKCGLAYPAGTKVREHGSGMSHIYNAATNKTAPAASWTQYAGVMEGCEKNTVSLNRWWPGTAYVRILILANYGQSKDSQLLVDDIAMAEVETTQPAQQGSGPTEEKDWKLQFSDDFNRDALSKGGIDLVASDWQALSGKWRIENGMLRGDSDAMIALLLRFPGDQRVEYDAVAQENICDLSAILSTSERGGYNDGYFFGFGSDNNAFSKLLIKGREVKRYDVRIVPGKLHHAVCQREGGRLTHIVDGKTVATYDDAQPLTEAGHDAIAFYINGSGKIDNVKVYTKGAGAESAPARFVAHAERATQPVRPLKDLVPDPLFEKLFGDTPGPAHFFTYGDVFDGRAPMADSEARPGPLNSRETAKRFGFRFVLSEKLDEAARYNLICYGRMSEPEYKKRGIATQSCWVDPPRGESYFYLPGDKLPVVSDGQAWIMDPRYLNRLVSEIEQRAREKEFWGIPMFDELWTYYVIRPVPRDKWYPQVIEADKEVREKYGFGKYGMPESYEAGDPFDRIAYRRWTSDKLTETFAKGCKAAKAVNPEMKVIGPTEGSSGTSADIEAWAPYFDIMGGQCGLGCTSAFFDSVRVGAVTKAYVDLTEKPIWMMVHACVQHAPRREAEDIREMYSQVFRNGGQGLWLMHSEFFEHELEDAMFAEPARWRAMLQLTKSISKMRLPRRPEPDCAILMSSDSQQTTLYGQFWGDDGDTVVSAYAVLGPLLRSWFHFVTDRQIERGSRNLGDYKTLYVPFAPYERASVVEKIGEYVQAGGTVVCTDTEAFSWNLDGERHGERWEKISGIRKVSKKDGITTFTTVKPNPLPLAAPLSLTSIAPGWNITPVNDTVRILAAFEDGSPAVTLHPYGKGKVIFFAADPLRAGDFFSIPEPLFSLANALDKDSLVAPGAPIVKLIEAIQKSAGAQMGRDIWRFKLPPFAEDPWQKETGLCLTGNYVFDVNAPLLEPNNIQTGGTYAYSRSPTGISDIGQPGAPISFGEGKLTNRLKAYETRLRFGPRKTDFDKITPQWIVSWTDAAPASVTFDLKGEHPLKKLRLFYSGTMPALQVSGSRDGNAWERLALAPEETAGVDVKDVAVALRGAYRHVKLDFAARQAGQKFELCEVEIWGESPK